MGKENDVVFSKGSANYFDELIAFREAHKKEWGAWKESKKVVE